MTGEAGSIETKVAVKLVSVKGLRWGGAEEFQQCWDLL